MSVYSQLMRHLDNGTIGCGDAVLFRYTQLGWLQRQICRIQRKALKDLRPLDKNMDPTAPYYTHVGMVFSNQLCVEMTSPRARIIDWAKRLEGIAEICIVRPVGALNVVAMYNAALFGWSDVQNRVRYPYFEILLYWLWAWKKKLRGSRFVDVFRSRKRNVCSGSVIDWWQRANIPLQLYGYDTWPESWYPARLAVDSRFIIITRLVDIENKGVSVS